MSLSQALAIVAASLMVALDPSVLIEGAATAVSMLRAAPFTGMTDIPAIPDACIHLASRVPI